MPTLNINGQSVQVDDSFLKLSPDQQHATVDEIAKSLPRAGDRSNDPYYQEALQRYEKRAAAGERPAGYLDRIIHGATLNASDEIAAALSVPAELLRAGNLDVGEAYKRAKALEDVRVNEARKNTGALGTAAEIGGGVLTGLGAGMGGLTAARALAPNAGLIARTAASAADAGAFGATAGAMEGNGLQERAGNALTGGLLGAGVGTVAPTAISTAKWLASPILSNLAARINPEGVGTTQVARALVESGQTPQQIAAQVAQAGREGQGMFTPADAMGSAGQRLLGSAYRGAGGAGPMIENFLEARQGGQGGRIANQLAEGFNAPLPGEHVRAARTAVRDTAANQEYEAARQNAGPVDVTPVIRNIDATLQPGANQIARPASGIRNDSIEAALQGVRERLTDNRSMLTDFTALQRVRGDLADQVQSAVQRGQGNRARLLGGVLRALDNQMEAASPGFRQANANFAQASRDIEAIAEGRTAATRGRTETTIPAFQRLGPEGQSAFRAGFVDPHIENVQRAAVGVNKARPFTSDAFEAQANAMAPGAAQMARQLARENTMFETRAAATKGSATAQRLADDAGMGVDPAMVADALSGNHMGVLRRAMGMIANGWNGNTAAVREQVARILLNRNLPPAAFQRMLDEATQRIMRIQTAARLAGRGLAGGLAVSPLNQR